MEITSYTSNIQPYGYSGGTNVASDSDGAKNAVSTQRVAADTASRPAPVQKEKMEPEKLPDTKSVEEIVEKRIALNRKELETMVKEMDHFVNSINRGLAFRIDEESGRNVVTIYEASTGDIIRQIPDEEMLDILKRLATHSSGLVEEKV